LGERGRLTDSEIANLKDAYSFLRRCESVLRRYDNKSVSAFSSDPNEQRKLAVRVGCLDLDFFREKYVDARETIHALYNQRVKNASG
jgi:glutamine synthetase adenylyltransferase